MIFERYEIEEMIDQVKDKSIRLKLHEVLSTTRDGRFTIHKTDKSKPNDVRNVGDLLNEDFTENIIEAKNQSTK